MSQENLETFESDVNAKLDNISDWLIANTLSFSGEAKGRACRAKHYQNFFKLIFSSVSILQVNMSFYVDCIFDLILAKTNTLYLIVCSAFDALC